MSVADGPDYQNPSNPGADGPPNTLTLVLSSSVGADSWDVTVPSNVEAHRLMGQFVRSSELGFKATDDAGNRIPYRLMWEQGQRYLGDAETLRQAGVANGDTLVMAHEARAGVLHRPGIQVTLEE